MGGLAFKIYKFDPFPANFLVHGIRKYGWELRDLLMKDEELRKKIKGHLDELNAEIKHIHMTGSTRKDDHDILRQKISTTQKVLNSPFDDLRQNIKKEVRDCEKIDFRGQT